MKKLLIIFFFVFKEIYLIPGTDEEGYDPIEIIQNPKEYEVDLKNVCPCDKTEGVCDFGCCCDNDCLNFMFDQNYYSLFSECDSSSSFKMTMYSKLDYCDGHKLSIDDLYNPLTLAFKILKTGFCLVKKKENNIIFDNSIINNEKSTSDDVYDPLLFGQNQNITPGSFSSNNIDNFAKMNFNVPIALPSGICLFGYYQIMKLQDYEVTCTYHFNQNASIAEYYNGNVKNFYIYKDYYFNEECKSNNIIKKIEIIYIIDSQKYQINHFYKVDDRSINNYQDLTFIVKFLKDESDYPKNGNLGYIKGNPILIRKRKPSFYLNSDNYSIYTILPKEKTIIVTLI